MVTIRGLFRVLLTELRMIEGDFNKGFGFFGQFDIQTIGHTDNWIFGHLGRYAVPTPGVETPGYLMTSLQDSYMCYPYNLGLKPWAV